MNENIKAGGYLRPAPWESRVALVREGEFILTASAMRGLNGGSEE